MPTLTTTIGKRAYFVTELRFYPCRDDGETRQPVNVGDMVWFTFYHDDTSTIARVVKINEHCGTKSFDLEQIKDDRG